MIDFFRLKRPEPASALTADSLSEALAALANQSNWSAEYHTPTTVTMQDPAQRESVRRQLEDPTLGSPYVIGVDVGRDITPGGITFEFALVEAGTQQEVNQAAWDRVIDQALGLHQAGPPVYDEATR